MKQTIRDLLVWLRDGANAPESARVASGATAKRYVPAVFAMLLGMSCVAMANDQADEEAIKTVIASFAHSWNLPDMPGFEDLFTKDADYVGMSGRWLKGRDEIVNLRRALRADLHKDSQLLIDAPTIRFLRPDIAALRPHVAVVHSVWSESYINEGKKQKSTTLAVVIFAKVQEKWRIAAVHN